MSKIQQVLLPLFTGILAAFIVALAPSEARAQRSAPESFAPLTARLRPAVVQVHTNAGSGSGFIIDPAGWIVTNDHVVRGASQVAVRLNDDRIFEVKIRGRDRLTDLALLKAEGVRNLPFVRWGESEDLREGDWVLAIGNPRGDLGGTVTAGIVSARERPTRAGGGGPYDHFLQTDAAINAGNSGGPLFNVRGEVIGVNTAIVEVVNDRIFHGIGFARPSAIVRPVVTQLLRYGQSRRGWLGVSPQPMTEKLASSVGLPRPRGVIVGNITPGGPAAVGGIKRFDVILKFNGTTVTDVRQFQRLVAETESGSKVKLLLWRRGKGEIELTVTLGRLAEPDPGNVPKDGIRGKGSVPGTAARENPAGTKIIGRLGIRGRAMAPGGSDKTASGHEQGGVRIMTVDVHGPMWGTILPGDVILEVEGTPVHTPETLSRRIASTQDTSHVIAVVLRNGTKELLAIPVD